MFFSTFWANFKIVQIAKISDKQKAEIPAVLCIPFTIIHPGTDNQVNVRKVVKEKENVLDALTTPSILLIQVDWN